MESKAAVHGNTTWLLPARLVAGLAILLATLTTNAEGPATSRAAAKFEVRFMTGMIDHHAMAVAMGTLCAEKAVHPELKALCEEMVAAQSAEIEQMQAWLQDWYGVTHEPEMRPGAERQMERLASLEADEFEIEFMRMMIRHHSIAVVRAANCLRRAAHEELIGMCEEMKAAQLDEIRTMLGWLCQWYDICPRGHSGNGGNA